MCLDMPLCTAHFLFGGAPAVHTLLVAERAMDAAGSVAGCFRQKTILVTGSTGFLGKMLVEKILRVQPDVKKLYLLVRAMDAASAEHRVLDEVIGKDLFNVLRDKYGLSFSNMIMEKVVPLAGDMMSDSLGLQSSTVDELSKEIDVIVNSAATTNFYERYDVALASNTLGARNMCQFAKRCANLKMLVHVSTAFVTGAQEGLVLEEPLQIGETPKLGYNSLDIDAELQLVQKVKSELKVASSNSTSCPQEFEKKTMRELGLKRANHFGWQNVYTFTKAMGEMLLGLHRGDIPLVIIRPSIITSTYQDPFPGWTEETRTIDAMIVAYEEQALPCFIGDRSIIIDAIPGDMVVNAVIVAIAAQWNTKVQVIYNVCSGSRNPLHAYLLEDTTYNYFSVYPRTKENGRSIKNIRLLLFKQFAYFQAYMTLVYKLPIEMLHVLNILLCGLLSRCYNKFNRDYKFLMLMAKLYEPFGLLQARFDDTNLTKLRMSAADMGHGVTDGHQFNFDPKIIDWANYLFDIHIPCVLKCSHEKKSRRAKK